MRHVTPSAGDAWKPAYSTRIAVCGDTWQDAADAYRNGAQSLPWSKATFRERKDMPELQRAPPLCISSQLDREDLDTPPDRLSAWGRRFNAPIVYRPLGWEKHGNWTGSDYFPPSIGEQPFRQLAARLEERGIVMSGFVSGYRWTTQSQRASSSTNVRCANSRRCRGVCARHVWRQSSSNARTRRRTGHSSLRVDSSRNCSNPVPLYNGTAAGWSKVHV